MHKKSKKIFSLFLAILMVLSVIDYTPKNALAVTNPVASDTLSYGLQDDVQDGLILHCWDWSFNNIKASMKEIAEAGYSAVQTSPIQEAKEATKGVANSNWWVFYQPKSFKIDDSGQSGLGTKAEFEAMCDEAHKYGIKVIVDVVANHTGNGGANGIANTVIDELKNDSSCYHNYGNFKEINYGNRYSITHDSMGLLPDLATENSKVQNLVLNFLKECIDSGADGFRFDAAKHIGVPSEGDSFWTNTLEKAKTYAKSSRGITLYAYGEILDGTGGPAMTEYTSMMSITENQSSNDLRKAVSSNNAASAKGYLNYYQKGVSASKLVLWAESHDTYSNDSRESTGVSQSAIDKTWALQASRANATALYYVRTQGWRAGKIGDICTNYWKGTEVAAVNKFHNFFVGQSEYIGQSGSYVFNERGTSGIVIVNLGGSSSVNFTVNKMADGTYTDQVSGNTFTVSGGKISGTMSSSGIAVVYNAVTKPTPTISKDGGNFSDTLTLTIGLKNATSGTYKIGSASAKTYTAAKEITIGADMSVGDTVTVKLTATDGKETTTKTCTFKKIERVTYTGMCEKQSGWGSTYYAYVYNTAGDKNAVWPGVAMEWSASDNAYVYQFTDLEDPIIIFNDGTNQYPAMGSKTELSFTSSSMKLSAGKTWTAVSAPVIDPKPTISQEGGEFTDDTLELTIGLLNATSGTYKIGSASAKTYTSTNTITIGDGMSVGDTVTVTLTATDGSKTTTKTYTFTKAEESTGSYVYFKNTSNWSTVNAYMWKGTTNNGPWPGKAMELYKDNIWRCEVDTTKGYEEIIFNNGSDKTLDLSFPGVGYIYSYSDGTWTKYETVKGKVQVVCKDEDGTVLQQSTKSGNVGSAYTIAAPSIDGYTLKTTPANASGTYTEATITVTFVYAKETTGPSVTSSLASGSSFTTETKSITLSLVNAKSGTYSVDDGPVKTFTADTKVVLGQGKIGDSTVTVKTTATDASGNTTSQTFSYKKVFKTTYTETSASPAASSDDLLTANTLASNYYSTNATGKGKQATITIDGDASDWTSDMKIAQGAAWDVANHYKGGHENCVLETYSLYAAWDSDNLYIGWQMVNTTDTWAREGDGPLSDGGRVLDVPLILALSVDPSSTSMSNKNTSGGPIWGKKMGLTFQTHVDRLFYMSGKPGLGKPSMFTAVDADGNTNYTDGCVGFADGGIEYKLATTNIENHIYGLNGSENPDDVYNNSADWVDYKTFAGSSGTHDTIYDSFYEMKIPLSTLGITKSYLETKGIGAMLIATRGESALDCIPFDGAAMLDNTFGEYSADASTSAEKDDIDNITVPFASIGNSGSDDPDDPVDLELNFGATKSAPQLAGTTLTVKGDARGGNGSYTYKFTVDGKSLGTKTSSTTASVSWTPSAAGKYLLKCVATDAKGNSVTSSKYFTIEGQQQDELTATFKTSVTTVAVGDSIKLTATAAGGAGSYTYKFVMVDVATGTASNLTSSYGTASSYTYTVKTAGDKKFYAKVQDADGTTVKTSAVTVTVQNANPLAASVKTDKTSMTVGQTVKITATATGGSGTYTYKYIMYDVTTGKTTTLKDYSTSRSYTATVTTAGNKKFYARVQDSDGTNIKTSPVTVTVSAATADIKATCKASSTTLAVGDTVKLTGSATGGNGSYKYKFVMYDASTGTTSTIRDYSTTATFSYKITTKGNKKFYVKVQDTAGNAGKSATVLCTVSGSASLKATVSLSATTVKTGASVVVTANASGGTGSYTYSYYCITGSTGKAYRFVDSTTSKTFTYKATSADTKDFYVVVKDSSGATVTTSKVRLTIN